MNIFLLNIALAFIWAALTGLFNPSNMALGFVFGYLILIFIRRAIGPTAYFAKVRQVVSFVVFLIWALVQANLRVAKRVILPGQQMQPRVVAVPLDTNNEAEITLLANLVSLTPGTLSLDVSSDRRVLFVHAINAPDPEVVRQDIKRGFERRVIDLLRGIASNLDQEEDR